MQPCKKSFALIKAKKQKRNLLDLYMAISSMRLMCSLNQHAAGHITGLTLIPSKRDRALRGLKALSVLSDLIGPRSEKPNALAIRLTIDTYTDRDRWRWGQRQRKTGPTQLER